MPRLFIVLLLALLPLSLSANDRLTTILAREGNLRIAPAACAAVERTLGQLFLIFTDGRGTNPPGSIHPEYIRAVNEMNIAGIRINSEAGGARASYARARSDVQALQARAVPPRLVSIDFGRIDPEQPGQTGSGSFFGLGTYGGILSRERENRTPECLARSQYLNAFLHRAIGANFALGPTIDPSHRAELNQAHPDGASGWWGDLHHMPHELAARMSQEVVGNFNAFGLATALKHFPYTPVHMDIHFQNRGVNESPAEVSEILSRYRMALSTPRGSDFVMSTHLLNRNIDSRIATVSPVWVERLRREIGFQGILLSDGLEMINAFDPDHHAAIFADWNARENPGIRNNISIFAALTILAGHDMIIIDNSLPTTRRVFTDLHRLACSGTPTGERLRARISDSSSRVLAYRNQQSTQLGQWWDVPLDLARETVALYSQMMYRSRGGPEAIRRACADTATFNRLVQRIEALRTTSVGRVFTATSAGPEQRPARQAR